MIRTAPIAGLGAVLALMLGAPAARAADSDLFSRETLAGVLQARLGSADGEPSWTDGGFGKSRFGGDTRLEIEGDLVWKPRLTWDLGAVVDLQAQPGQAHGVDLGEAFLRYKPTPRGPTRFTARAGLFYPDISHEHDGPAWTVTDTITPSAINSWVGEELKVLGVEGTITHAFDGQEVSLTGAVFYYGDTAGTLLSLRGWSLSDLKSTAYGHFGLPPLSGFLAPRQAPYTTPVKEIDGRPGWYGQLAWRRHGLALDLLYYDNGGDRTSRTAPPREWAWDTRFLEAGAVVDFDAANSLRVQALRGVTYMGYSTPQIWIDNGYNAAFGLFTHRFGDDALSVRADWFEVTDRTWKAADPNREWGWGFTGAWRHALAPRTDLLLEVLHVKTYGEARERTGVDEYQTQTVGQAAVRYRF